MRKICLFLSLIPSLSFAIGKDSCWLEGTINNKVVHLSFIDDEGYGLLGSSTYGYCKTEYLSENIRNLSCASNKNTKPIVYYKTKDIENYICTKGCSKEFVQTFKLHCDSGC